MLSAPITATDTMTEEMHSNGQLTDSPHITATAPLTALSSSPSIDGSIFTYIAIEPSTNSVLASVPAIAAAPQARAGLDGHIFFTPLYTK